jgi:hypothetical protein
MTGDLTAAVTELRTTADMWTRMSGQIRQAGDQAASASLAQFHAGPFAATVVAYDNLADYLAGLLRGGQRSMDDLATALRTVAALYETADQTNAQIIA